MDLISGTPLWPARDGPMPVYPPLERSTRCDVAIIGSGVTGACLAGGLVQDGWDVVVLDRRPAGGGSTAGSTGLLQYELDTPLADLAARMGEEPAARCYRICADAIAEIGRMAARLPRGCGFRRRFSLCGARTRAQVEQLRREQAIRRRHGYQVELLGRAELAAISTLPYQAALRSRPAAEIDAHAFTHGLLAAAAARGARIHGETAVRDYRPEGRTLVLRTSRGLEVRARRLLIAAGYELQPIVRPRLSRLVSTFTLASEPLAEFPGWPQRCLIWEAARPYCYLRTTADGRAVIGGADRPHRSAARRDRELPERARRLRERFGRLFPGIPFRPAFQWAGTFAETRDGLPFIGAHPALPRAWLALGYGGNGITFAVVAARILRALCAGRRDADAAWFRFGR
jgi:glycine/D-amino acid oxidase-like deaminating enzyme